MSFPKVLVFFACILFGIIALIGMLKGRSNDKVQTDAPREVEVATEIHEIAIEALPIAQADPEPQPKHSDADLPDANRVEELFNKVEPHLPVVETVIYKSKVPWLKGRPAWISDYAVHYGTSRHFIARSLNGKPDYFKQEVVEGAKFNVFRKDRPVQFYLVVDVSRCKMWFYCYDVQGNEKVLLKTYMVGLGRLDSAKSSGSLTPLGCYSLGSKIGIYKPGIVGVYGGEKKEMIRIFGTRWIPFDKEVKECTAPAKGLGIHGLSWKANQKGDLVEDRSGLGKHEGDGGISLAAQDIEEIFAIVITKPTYIELVKDFFDANVPGIEK